MSNTKPIKGDPSVPSARMAIVYSRFNGPIVERLLAGAIDALVSKDIEQRAIEVIEVPGAFEIPLVLEVLAASGKYDGLIALGAVIRGETAHFEYVAGECARGVADVSRDHAIAVGFGVLTVETEEQALERAGGKEGNKGAEAALTALELMSLLRKLDK